MDLTSSGLVKGELRIAMLMLVCCKCAFVLWLPEVQWAATYSKTLEASEVFEKISVGYDEVENFLFFVKLFFNSAFTFRVFFFVFFFCLFKCPSTFSMIVEGLLNEKLPSLFTVDHSLEISSGCSLKGLMLKLKLQYFGHLMQRADSFEKTLMLGKIEGRKRRGRQRMRWLVASLTQWTWVWVDSRS